MTLAAILVAAFVGFALGFAAAAAIALYLVHKLFPIEEFRP